MTAAERDATVMKLSDAQRARVRAAMLAKFPPRSWDGQSDGDRLVDHFGHELRWISDAKSWAYWTGRRWSTDGAATEVLNRCRRTVDALPRTEAAHYNPVEGEGPYDPLTAAPETDAATPDPKSQRAAFLKFVRSRRTLSTHNAMTVEATGTGALSVLRDQFDRHAMLLSVGNGVLHMADMTLSGHAPDLLMMLGTDVPWEPDAECPTWLELLRRALPTEGARDHLQRWIGYSLTGRTDESAAAVHHGPAKGVRRAVFSILREVFGTYAQAVPKSTLVEKPNDTSVPNDLARMAGRRLLLVPEPVRSASLDEETVNALREGTPIPARHMKGEWFEFAPVGKLHMLFTHMPGLGTDAPGAAEGMQVIGWHRQMERAELAAMVDQIMDRELPGVLAWAARGSRAWQVHGLAAPDDVRERTADALFHGSVLAQWHDARLCPIPADQFTELRDVYPDYAAWAERAGERPVAVTRFGAALAEQFGIDRRRGPNSVDRRSVLYGVALVADGSAPARVEG